MYFIMWQIREWEEVHFFKVFIESESGSKFNTGVR